MGNTPDSSFEALSEDVKYLSSKCDVVGQSFLLYPSFNDHGTLSLTSLRYRQDNRHIALDSSKSFSFCRPGFLSTVGRGDSLKSSC